MKKGKEVRGKKGEKRKKREFGGELTGVAGEKPLRSPAAAALRARRPRVQQPEQLRWWTVPIIYDVNILWVCQLPQTIKLSLMTSRAP